MKSVFGSQSSNFQNVFEQHATEEKGEKVLTRQAFGQALQSDKWFPISDNHIDLLFKACDRTMSGYITLVEFLEFEKILQEPDGQYQILSRLISGQAKGKVSKEALNLFAGFQDLPKGIVSSDVIEFNELSQLVEILKQKRLELFFSKHDSKHTGYVSTCCVSDWLHSFGGYRKDSVVLKNLKSIGKLSYSEFTALFSILEKLDVVRQTTENVFGNAQVVSKQDFYKALSNTMKYSQVTPLEVDMLFSISGNKESLNVESLVPVFYPSIAQVATFQPVKLSAGMETLKSIYNFTLGSIAGAIGAFAVYPIDLVKTRMQNQKTTHVGQILYKNGIDCFRKVIKTEGFLGLYSGLIPQLIGVAPEKAIKLAMNDLVRSRMKDPNTGALSIYAEILAGMCAGGSQVLFTNPLEIVKIRLQMQGEIAKAAAAEGQVVKLSAITVVKELGLLGLYKGVGACLLRDIPFSGIFFPTYAHVKKDVFEEGKNGKKLSIPELLASGAIAGMPAAYLVTPADVIKTRLQTQARKGVTTYNGMFDAFTKILKEEGPTAFYKGGIARILRSSPQFGVTLASYEILQTLFHVDFGDNPSKGLPSVKMSPAELGAAKTARMFSNLGL